jgi:AcrR family transcriptional regulator
MIPMKKFCLQQKTVGVAFMRRKDLDEDRIRECLTGALLQLMKEKEYGAVSVGEIAGRAGVHRATFYRHFRSKEDVLRAFLSQIFKGAAENREMLQKDFSSFIRPVFQTLYDKKEPILLLQCAGLSGLFMDALKDYFDLDGQREAPGREKTGAGGGETTFGAGLLEEYRTAYRIGGIYSCLLLWFSHGMAETPEEMTRIASSM